MIDTNMRLYVLFLRILRACLINMRGTDRQTIKQRQCKIYEVNIKLRIVSKTIN